MSSTLFFKELSLTNFLSFGNSPTIIDLSEIGTVAIEGHNLDVVGSNGSGKSTIINALCYALFNKPFDNISLQRLINSTNAAKSTRMEVSLSFTRDNIEYEIIRARGESYTINLFKDGVDITPGKGVTECDALIEQIIGVSYDLFTKTIIFSGSSVAFLQLPVAQQRTQIEELFNITLLSEKAKLLKDNIRTSEGDLKVQEAIYSQELLAIELHQKHIADAQARVTKWEQTRMLETSGINKTLSTISNVDFELEQLLHDEKTSLAQEQSALKIKLTPAKKDYDALVKSVQALLVQQEHLVEAKCPYCLQQFADAPLKLSSLETAIETSGTQLIALEEQVQELEAQSKILAARVLEVSEAIQHPNLKELLAARENAAVLQAKLLDLLNAQNPHTEAVQRLELEGCSAANAELVDKLKKRLEHMAFLLKLLTSKDSFLRRRIISRTIPFLNTRINHYTSQLGLPHVVKFDADLSCTVSEFGRDLDFGNLSAGEKKRVNTGMALAFRDVLHHLHAKSNLLIIDELDGALDSSGIDAIVRILKEKSRDEALGIYVISHHPNIAGRLDRTMTVQKEHGFSTIL